VGYPGQAADGWRLSVDPLAADPAAVRENDAIETAVGGVIVHTDPARPHKGRTA